MYYFIVNKQAKSGSAGKVWSKAEDILRAMGVDYRVFCTMYKNHAMELAGRISRLPDEDKRIVVVGGDGTINEVVNGITDFEHVSLSVIPTGSGNDFARGLKLPKDPEEGLRNILNCKKEEWMDLGQITCPECDLTRLYAISAGVGMDALVCKKTNTSNIKKVLNAIHLGKLSYIILTIQSLFTMTTEDAKVIINNAERKLKINNLIFLASMNFFAEGGGVPMAPGASAFDGEISLCAFSNVSKWRAFTLLPVLVMAKHEKLKAVDMLNCKKLEIITDGAMAVHTDGEYQGDYTHVIFECIEKKLRIRR